MDEERVDDDGDGWIDDEDPDCATDEAEIGIGAGPECDGQVLVLYDLLGLDATFKPKFLKKYTDLNRIVVDAVRAYTEEVKTGAFPTADHSH